jgi:hypothetical protein
MTVISINHAGQLCYYCHDPIYGDGIIDSPPAENWVDGRTSFHPSCYKESFLKHLLALRSIIDLVSSVEGHTDEEYSITFTAIRNTLELYGLYDDTESN